MTQDKGLRNLVKEILSNVKTSHSSIPPVGLVDDLRLQLSAPCRAHKRKMQGRDEEPIA
jgi:hypothetical protein